jgi:hypothetical protein
MAETKPITKDDGRIEETTGRRLRTIEQTINEPLPPPDPSQEEADAILLGEYTGEEEAAPEGETHEQRKKREEDTRKKREAKAAADQQASYQTRNA